MLRKVTWGGITAILIVVALVMGSYAPQAVAQVFNYTNTTQGFKVTLFNSAGTEITSFGGDGAITDGDTTGEADVMSTDPVGTEQGLVVRVTGLSRDCAEHVSVSDAASGDSELIPLASGEDIIICHVFLASTSTTANSVRLVYGTGSNCATGQTGLTGLLTLDYDAGVPGFSVGNAGGIYFIPTGNAVCLETSASEQVSGSLTFVQYDATP